MARSRWRSCGDMFRSLLEEMVNSHLKVFPGCNMEVRGKGKSSRGPILGKGVKG